MEITIKGSAKEIAELVVQTQTRLNGSVDLTGIKDYLIAGIQSGMQIGGTTQ